MEDVLGHLGLGIALANGEGLCDLDYANHLVRLFESTEQAQRALDRLARVVALIEMCFAPSKCKMVIRLVDSNTEAYTRWKETNHCWTFRLPRQLHDEEW